MAHQARTMIALIVLLAALVPVAAEGQGTEVVRGRVLDTQKKPIAGVDVTITGQANGAVQLAKTDAKGEYVATFRDPQGTYALSFRKVGYGAYSRSVQQSGLSNIITVPDAVLPGGLNVLQPIVTTTLKLEKVPTRAEFPSIGGSEMNTANNGLFLLDPGDLNQLAAKLPGMQNVGDSSFSVFGVPPSQNKVVVDGADFGDMSLPRDAMGSVKVVTNTFDASKGQFAGAETVVTTRHGGAFFLGQVRAQLSDPHLAWADPDAPAPVPQIGGTSGGVGGPIVPRKLAYFASFDLSNQVTAAPSLLAPRQALLEQLGISPDSVAVAELALARLGVPLTSGGIPVDPTRFLGKASVNLDYTVDPVTSFTLSVTGNWNHGTGQGVSELAFPSSSDESHRSRMEYLLTGGTYFRRILEDIHLSLSPSSSRIEPYLALPTGRVLVGTTFSSGQAGLGNLGFGGSGSGVTTSSSNSWDAQNELSWATTDTRQQFKFTQELRHDWGNSQQLSSPFGSYTYQSLADLATNTPSEFTRALSTVARSYDATISALSLGDIWRAVPGKLEFQIGGRFDGTTFGTRPAYNAAIDSLFGVRTDHVPADYAITPRFGFTWSPKARRNGALPDGMTIIDVGGHGGFGAVGRKSALDAAGLGLLPPGSDVAIAGGVGAYHGPIASPLIGALTDETGLSSTTQYLTCVGPATPMPDWSTAGAGSPTACADGTGAASFTATQPRVTVFDPSYRALTSWRGVLQLKGWHIHDWGIGPQLVYFYNVNSESSVDLNLRRTAQFTLPDEGNRPVYAAPGDIVPATGLFSPTAGRVSSSYGRVTEVLSDLHTDGVQLLLPVVPPKPLFGKIPVYFVYAYDVQHMQQRGFNGTTAGDPFAVQSVVGSQPQHQFTVGASNIRLWWFTLAARFDLYSGVPYTPVVGQDINGDGVANDRAFIASPATVADTGLARQMSALLAAAPSGARSCLQAQFGTIAGANSCRTPWQGQLDLNVAFSPPQSFGLSSRLKVMTTMLNAGGALVRLMGLQNTPLGQASPSIAVDPRLLYVTGFDPVAQRFQYKVNQLFGEPLDYGSARHRYPPFELQLGLQYRLGYPSTAQTAKNLGVFQTGKDTVGLAERARTEIKRRTFGVNPIDQILALRDSLALSPEQVTSIQAVGREYARHVDSLIAPVVAFVVQRGNKLTSDEFNAKMAGTSLNERNFNATERQKAVAFLLPEQRVKLTAITHQN